MFGEGSDLGELLGVEGGWREEAALDGGVGVVVGVGVLVADGGRGVEGPRSQVGGVAQPLLRGVSVT